MSVLCPNCSRYVADGKFCPFCGHDLRKRAEEFSLALKSGSVVGDRYGAPPAVLDDHGDLPCAGVQGIFDEFLCHVDRTLHDLTCRDLADHAVAQQVDFSHGGMPP